MLAVSGTDRLEEQGDPATERTVTVLVAGAANLAVAVAKAVAGVVSGSAAMQAEAAHSIADTVTEIFLFVAARRGTRGPDPQHPFGHGRETYLWAFLAALATFVAGAGFSLARGVETLVHGEPPDPASTLISYAVLAFAFLVEGVSLLRGRGQARRAATAVGLSPGAYQRVTTDTTVKAVIFEDVAALIGLVLAAAGVGLRQLTGQSAWDGLASMAVGVLLVVAAASLARTNLSLLIGQAARPQLQAGPARRSRIAARHGVRAGLRRRGDRSRLSSHRREGALRRRLLGCRHRALRQIGSPSNFRLTSMLPRVALEYGQSWSARASTLTASSRLRLSACRSRVTARPMPP